MSLRVLQTCSSWHDSGGERQPLWFAGCELACSRRSTKVLEMSRPGGGRQHGDDLRPPTETRRDCGRLKLQRCSHQRVLDRETAPPLRFCRATVSYWVRRSCSVKTCLLSYRVYGLTSMKQRAACELARSASIMGALRVRLAAGRLTPDFFASSLTKPTPEPDVMESLSKLNE